MSLLESASTLYVRQQCKSLLAINITGSKMLLLLLLTLILHSLADEKCSNICFHEPAEACPRYDEPKCKISSSCPGAVICCHLSENIRDSIRLIETNRSNIDKLHIRNITIKSFDLRWLKTLKVSSLSLTDGNINTIVGGLPKQTKTRCLNFSSNGIKEFQNESIKHASMLRILDLSHNNLSHIPPFRLGSNITLDISDNRALLCHNLIDTMKKNVTFNNGNETVCLSSSTFQWFNSTEFLSLTQVERFFEMKTNCTLKNCSCEAHRWDFNHGQEATLAMMVDCAGRQLTQLPSPLPANTIALNISNNNITSLDAMSDDPSYGNLRELYADHNKIVSILPLLDSSKFISTFSALSLRHNKLKTVPTYVLSNIFDRNDNFRYLNLGQNRLECDCNTAKVLKVWLLNKEKHITDYEEIFCDNVELRVVDLDTNKLCKTQQDWTDYIYYIITGEVLLLILLIAKVSYDYWVFKTAGYLPWPASKMPKLPCDWLCE